ncbi:peptide chain release factor N(5)-glutamine methyltransferase [Hahella ganghwensis]|uniref:peptide chain release factor N(5)-glutamine methyltransferase n=1 Tax=Hahella ganghwensis TaxID=286420 RepID=UPI00037716EB|nr:peptide chain release factor N(5)-glutamine methyltransferase [Hahella ganghwensis]
MKISEALRWAQNQLDSDTARLDAEVLLCHLLGVGRVYLFTHDDQDLGRQLNTFKKMIERRRCGEPVAHITGVREFWSLPLQVTPATLIPRPDTETLVEWCLDQELPATARVLDLGTGTGAIACALASERPGWSVTATDRSREALEVASRNKTQIGLENLELVNSDWFGSLTGLRFDLIVSNPPYIAEGDEHLSSGDVRFEPKTALVSGVSGLDDILIIAAGACEHFDGTGWLALEHGYDQGESVRDILENTGYRAVETIQDLAGQDRITVGFWSQP